MNSWCSAKAWIRGAKCIRSAKNFRQLLICANGSVAILLSVILPLLIGAMAIAVDVGRLNGLRSEAQSTLDSAVLAAIKGNSREDAEQILERYLSSHPIDAKGTSVNTRIDAYSGIRLTAITDIALQTTFAGMFGIKSMSARVASGAERAWHQDIYFAVDLSSSLGVGATDADRTALEILTQPYSTPAYGATLPQGCAFGCHRREGWEPAGKTVYQMARDAGIKLREDELMGQFGGIVDLLLDPSDDEVQKGMRRLSVLGFSGYAEQLLAPSDDAASVKSALNYFPNDDRFETSYDSLFLKLTAVLGAQGDGSSADPHKMLVMITDGVESRDAFFSQRAIDVSLCQKLKDDGFRLAVVEIKYPKLTANRLYNDTVLPVEDDISPALASCASSGWYFQALGSTEVATKFEELKMKIAASGVRLIK